MLNRLVRFFEQIDKLSRRGVSPRFIQFLILQGVTQKAQFKDKAFMEGLFERLEENGFSVSDVQLGEEDGFYLFSVSETKNGGQRFDVDWELLASPELRQLMRLGDDFRELKKGSYRTGPDGQKERIEDPEQLLRELMERAQKGLGIQRYKGLGEMNPDQLWTTTMDPDKRRLVRVTLEDAVEADKIFSILMGDQVEPRREFIQNNALEVKELDI